MRPLCLATMVADWMRLLNLELLLIFSLHALDK